MKTVKLAFGSSFTFASSLFCFSGGEAASSGGFDEAVLSARDEMIETLYQYICDADDLHGRH